MTQRTLRRQPAEPSLPAVESAPFSLALPLPLLPQHWLAPADVVRQIVATAERLDPAQAAAFQPRQSVKRPGAGDKIRLVDIAGPMTKYSSWLSWIFGGTSTIEAAAEIRQAAADDSVGAIIVRVDSPGGEHRGTDDLHQTIRDAAKVKPVVAFIEDLGASAAYYAASAATKIVANESAIVGSLGVVILLYDHAVEFERAGVKAVVVSTAPLKGLGAPGSEITKEQVAELQRIVNGMGELFLRRVVAGRKLTPDFARAELFTGQMFTAAQAKRLRLIDEVGTLADVVSELRSGFKDSGDPARNGKAATLPAAQAPTPAAEPKPSLEIEERELLMKSVRFCMENPDKALFSYA